MSDLIVVIGATGHVGGEICRVLLGRGLDVRAVARGVEKLWPLTEHGAHGRAGSLEDPAFVRDALEGAAAAFVMIPPNPVAADHAAWQRRIVDNLAAAIRAAKVRHVVTLSSVGAELESGTGLIAGLHELERSIDAIEDVSVVHLRAGWFMENHFASLATAKSHGVLASPMRGDLPLPMVAASDVALAAADLLATRRFEGKSVRYVLGPHDVTLAEAAITIGVAIGRPDLFNVRLDEDTAFEELMVAGASPSFAKGYLEMTRAFDEGRIRAERTPASTTVTTLETFARNDLMRAFAAEAEPPLYRILVPLDGSELAEKILLHVSRLVSRRDAEVVLTTVVTDVGGGTAGVSPLTRAHHYLDRVKARLETGGARVTTRVRVGDAAEKILEAAHAVSADLICIATHGRSGVSRLVRGSVCEEVLRTSTIPVLAANPSALPDMAKARFEKILVALDGSEESASILPLVANLAELHGSEVVLLHAAEMLVVAGFEGAVGAVPSLSDARRVLERDRDRLGDVPTRLLPVIGPPATAILDAVASEQPALVAMTTHGRSGLSRWVLGSVAESVLRECPVPVLVKRTVEAPPA